MWTFFHSESQDKAVPVRRQFGNCRSHPEIDITVGKIEGAKLFAVERHAVRIVNIVIREKTIPGRLLAADLAYQVAVAELLVPDEHDPLDEGLFSLVDFKGDIDAVLRKFDNLGLDTRCKAARPPVDFENALDIALRRRARENLARLELHFGTKRLIVNPPVSFECNTVDDRVLGNCHHHDIAAHVDTDIGEIAGFEQALQGVADGSRPQDIARLQAHIGTDGFGVHALRADDLDVADGAARLGVNSRRRQHHSGGQRPCGKCDSPSAHGVSHRRRHPTTRSKNATT